MEEDQELRNLCKLGNQRFDSGRSLGHMRSDLTINSRNIEQDHKKIQMGFEENGPNAVYGLRQNPKKSSKVPDTEDCSSQQQKHCRKCGKGFQSAKALYGHMRCHSRKRTDPKQKRLIDNETDNETEAPLKRKRSRRTRYKINSNPSLSNSNDSSSVSYQIEQELEDIAMCLMMLSRGVRTWDGFNVLTESSDNNSVSFEANEIAIEKEENENLRKERTCFDANIGSFDKKISELGASDSEETKLELAIQFSDTQTDHENEIKLSEIKVGKDLMEELGIDRAHSDSMKSNLGNIISSDSSECNICKNELIHTNIRSFDKQLKKNPPLESKEKGTSQLDNELKKSVAKHECAICFKVFSSGQALGGHKRAHLAANSESKAKQSTTTA